MAGEGREQENRLADLKRRWHQAPLSRVFAPLADQLRCDGQLEEALSVLDAGLERHPDFSGGLLIRGRTLLDADRSKQARQVLRRVLELDAHNREALRLLAEDARSRQEWAAAVPYLTTLVAIEPAESRWAGALQEARRRVGDAPLEPGGRPSFATLTLVDIYLAQGYRAKARAALEQMLAEDPRRQDVRERLAAWPGGAASGADTEASRAAVPGEVPPGVSSALHRERDKEQFSAWINRIRESGDATP